MSGQRWRARIAALCVAAGVLTVLLSPQPAQTEASWTDPEVAQGTFTAITVPPPGTGGSCVIVGSLLNLLNSQLSVKWTLPAGHTTSNMRISYTGSGGVVPVVDTLLGSNLKTTESAGVYTTTLKGALLNAVLGGTRVISVHTLDASGWVSDSRTVTGVWPALALDTATCTDSVTPKPS